MAREISYYTKSAVKINGTYIEEVIEGYSTLSNSGRETLERQLELYEAGMADGETVQYTRFPGRTIQVEFLITGGNLNQKMAQLMSILSPEKAEFVFNDEADKYYIGTPTVSGEVEKGIGFVKGEYQINCVDPFKYAVEETEVAVTTTYDIDDLEEYNTFATYYKGDMCKRKSGVEWVAYECNTDGTTGAWNASKWDTVNSTAFVVDYDGGYKTYPHFEVNFANDESSSGDVGNAADCGFVQFAKAYGDDYKRIQFGDDEQVQWIPTGGWSVSFLKNTLGSFVNRASGTYLGWIDDATAAASDKGLFPKYGSNTTGYHGSFLRRTAEADRNFKFTWTQEIVLSSSAQTFGFIAAALDTNDNIVAGVKYYKGNTTSKEGTINIIMDGQTIESRKCDFGYHGMFGYDYGKKNGQTVTSPKIRAATNYIKRKDNVITIKLADKTSVITLYPNAETPIARVGFFLTKYKDKASPSANHVRFAKFEGSSEDNTFTSNDVLVVDCSSADIKLNGVQDLSLGDVGNQWNDMFLDIGKNIIFTAFSEWCQKPPIFKLIYRKRWI